MHITETLEISLKQQLKSLAVVLQIINLTGQSVHRLGPHSSRLIFSRSSVCFWINQNNNAVTKPPSGNQIGLSHKH